MEKEKPVGKSQEWIFGREFCDYPTVGKCGRVSEDKSGRCKMHKGVPLKGEKTNEKKRQ